MAACPDVIHRGLVLGMVADGIQLLEAERVAPAPHPGQRLGIPVGLELAVYPGEIRGQGRIHENLQVAPAVRAGPVVAVAVNQSLDFVQDFLGARAACRRWAP